MSIHEAERVAGARRAGRRLVWVAAFGAGGLLLSVVYRVAGVGVPCPFLQLTGWQCPLCGGTRMGSALLTGDVSAAFWFNPVALVGLVLLAVLATAWLVQWRGGPQLRVPQPVRSWFDASPGWLRTAAWVVPLLGWTVLRNL